MWTCSKCRYFLLWPDLWRHRWPPGQQNYVMLNNFGRAIKRRLNFENQPSSIWDRRGLILAPQWGALYPSGLMFWALMSLIGFRIYILCFIFCFNNLHSILCCRVLREWIFGRSTVLICYFASSIFCFSNPCFQYFVIRYIPFRCFVLCLLSIHPLMAFAFFF